MRGSLPPRSEWSTTRSRGTVRCAPSQDRLGHTEHARLLQETLDEEDATDHKLMAMADRIINLNAAKD